jgi:hypothetical protein
VKPDNDGGASGDGGGGVHDLEPGGNFGDEGRKKFVSRAGLLGGGGSGGSGLFFSQAAMDLANSSSSLTAISVETIGL